MNSTVSDIEIPKVVENLNSKDSEVLNDALQSLIMICQLNKAKDLLPSSKDLFNKLERLLSGENLSTVVQASQLVMELINSSVKEIEPHFSIICPKVILNLGDSKV